jgi:hypothetical protein
VEKNLSPIQSEVLFGTADKAVSRQVSKLVAKGLARRIAPRLYTTNLTDTTEAIVQRNLFVILGNLFKGALLSHRSALEFRPTDEGHIFLTYDYTRKVELPGITVRLLEGPGPKAGDQSLAEGLYVSQKPRAILENLMSSRSRDSVRKTLPLETVEEKLEQTLRVHGEEGLNHLRDGARALADELNMQREFTALDRIIGALLATRNANVLTSPLAAARAFGLPYDPQRVELFGELFRALSIGEFKDRPDGNLSVAAFRNFAFYESYFSNYIEGTEFGVEEARGIIESGMPLAARHHDSHDILGTYRIVSDREAMRQMPKDDKGMLELLRHRHAILLGARAEKSPGSFKDKNNFAGQTAFVDFQLVRGTLIKGFGLLNGLSAPFSRAAFVMFLVSEVHPFLDGNGRVARVMMNAELVAAGQSRIIIPTVYRDDYMGALRKLTRQGDAGPYIRMLERAFAFSAALVAVDAKAMHRQLERCNAFLDPNDGPLLVPE